MKNQSKPPRPLHHFAPLTPRHAAEKLWLKRFLASWRASQAARIEAMLPKVSAKDICRQLESLPLDLFPDHSGDDRLEVALLLQLQRSGINAHDVLKAADALPTTTMSMRELFQADEYLRADFDLF